MENQCNLWMLITEYTKQMLWWWWSSVSEQEKGSRFFKPHFTLGIVSLLHREPISITPNCLYYLKITVAFIHWISKHCRTTQVMQHNFIPIEQMEKLSQKYSLQLVQEASKKSLTRCCFQTQEPFPRKGQRKKRADAETHCSGHKKGIKRSKSSQLIPSSQQQFQWSQRKSRQTIINFLWAGGLCLTKGSEGSKESETRGI